MRRSSRLPSGAARPLTENPVVVLSVYAEADLVDVARYLRQDQWSIREVLRFEVSQHGNGELSDRVFFDRWNTMVDRVRVTYDIFPNDTIMIVSCSDEGYPS